MSENAEMQETILMLRQRLNLLSNKSSASAKRSAESEPTLYKTGSGDLLGVNWIGSCDENCIDENTPTSVINLNRVFSQEDSRDCGNDAFINSQVLMQVILLQSHCFLWLSFSSYALIFLFLFVQSASHILCPSTLVLRCRLNCASCAIHNL